MLGNIYYLSFTALSVAIQMFYIFIWISSGSSPQSFLYPIILPEYTDHIHPEKDLSIYRAVVILALVAYVLCLAYWKRVLCNPINRNRLKWAMVGQASITGIASCYVLTHTTSTAWSFVGSGIILGNALLAIIIFRINVEKVGSDQDINFSPKQEVVQGKLEKALEYATPFFVVLCLWMTDIKGAVAQIFVNDQFHHLDSFIAAPGHAFSMGNTLFVDTFSEYGSGMPRVLSSIAQMLGGVNYEHILTALMGVAVVYYLILYGFLRFWTRSVLAATAGILLALSIAVFWPNLSDYFIWKYPSATIIRYAFDMTFFFMLVAYARQGKMVFWFTAVLVNAVALFYVSDSGLYLWVSAIIFVLLRVFKPILAEQRLAIAKNQIIETTSLLASPAIAFFFMYLSSGPAVWTSAYWNNASEYIKLALGCFESLEITWGLKGEFLGPLMLGVLMLGVYLWTLFVGLGKAMNNKLSNDEQVMIPLAVYGLCLYQYFIFRSSPYNFFVISIPFAVLITWHAYRLILCLPKRWQRLFLTSIAVVLFIVLVTRPAFVRYPHVLHLKSTTFDAQKQEYQQRLDVKEDVKLIVSLTKPDQQVPLISDHDVKILMDAGRKPFFYYFPLVNSRQIDMLDFGGMHVYTKPQLERIITQIVEQKPPYVFVESKYIFGLLPEAYYQKYTSLSALMLLLKAYYEPVAKGKYLTALKRKEIATY